MNNQEAIITIGSSGGGFIAKRGEDTAILIQNINITSTGALPVRGFWSRKRLFRLRPTVGKLQDLKRYWEWLSDES